MKAAKVIVKNFNIFNKDPINGISIGFDDENIFNWGLIILGPKDSPYEGGIYNAEITFPQQFPLQPPKFKFKDNIYHPNIYKNGEVCISILHPPGDDKYGYETSSERWRPVHTVNSILISILLLLSSPNIDSPANIDAGKLWRKDKKEFQKLVNKLTKENN